MRKSFDQFWIGLLDEGDALNANGSEILTRDSGDELRGGDRPYMPVIYEMTTGKTNSQSTTLLENLGLNIH